MKQLSEIMRERINSYDILEARKKELLSRIKDNTKW